MRAVIQRVSRAKVSVGKDVTGQIGRGLLVLLGVSVRDMEKDAVYLVEKTLNLRIFEDAEDKMNLSLLDISGELLVVSQFTLYGDATRGLHGARLYVYDNNYFGEDDRYVTLDVSRVLSSLSQRAPGRLRLAEGTGRRHRSRSRAQSPWS